MLAHFNKLAVEAYDVVAVQDESNDRDGLQTVLYLSNKVFIVKEPFDRVMKSILNARKPDPDDY